MSANVVITEPKRGGGTQARVEFVPQSLGFTWSWGVEAAEARIVYAIEDGASGLPAIASNAWVELSLYGRTFWGVCLSAPASTSSGGRTLTLNFKDTRFYLDWDVVFGCFNKLDIRMVNATRVKRYWHILPANWERGIKTFTDRPYTAAEILDFVFGAGTVASPWVRVYHQDQVRYPVYDVDCMGGKKLKALVAEVCEKQGLVVTLDGGPFRLVFGRMGEGLIPTVPVNTDHLESGLEVTDNASRVYVVGGRNLYQVLDVALTADWNRKWETFYNGASLEMDLFDYATVKGSSVRLNAIPGDVERMQGAQLAAAMAKEITVGEYAALRLARDGQDFSDRRRFGGRSRMDMPAALYLSQVVFRAFRPPIRIPIGGHEVPLESLDLVEEQVARVTHDIGTGAMSALLSDVVEGNGYAIAKGYQVGTELMKAIKPDRFNLDAWLQGKSGWGVVPFQLDRDGEGSQFVIFDVPVVDSADLVQRIDGHGVVNVGATFGLVAVRAALTFAAERYVFVQGEGSRDDVLNVDELRKECVVSSGGAVVTEVPYGSGLYPDGMAREMARVFLRQQAVVLRGGYQRNLLDTDVLQGLSGMVNRVTVQLSSQGRVEHVQYATELGRRAFESEREFDRRARAQGLLPGQAELRVEADQHRKLAQVLKLNAWFRRELFDAWQGKFGTHGAMLHNVHIASPTNTKLAAGTPLWKKPTAVGASNNTETLAVMPTAVTSSHKVFAGVVVRHNEDARGPIRAQATGEALARVKGPVEAGDVLARVVGADYLGKQTDVAQPSVGIAQQDISGTSVRLCQVLLGSGGGGGSVVEAVWA